MKGKGIELVFRVALIEIFGPILMANFKRAISADTDLIPICGPAA